MMSLLKKLFLLLSRSFNQTIARVMSVPLFGISKLISLKNIKSYLKAGGVFIFDVNHRHNIKEYGYKALGRIVIDNLNFKRSRGDVVTKKMIDGKEISLYGHLFIEDEIKTILDEAGFNSVELIPINYSTGEKELTKYFGQLLVIAHGDAEGK